MANEQNLKPWKPGQSGNPNGRPSVDQKLKELREAVGIEPREELIRIANDKRTKLETRVRVLKYLDEQFNGRAKQSVDSNNANTVYVMSDQPMTLEEWTDKYVTEE